MITVTMNMNENAVMYAIVILHMMMHFAATSNVKIIKPLDKNITSVI